MDRCISPCKGCISPLPLFARFVLIDAQASKRDELDSDEVAFLINITAQQTHGAGALPSVGRAALPLQGRPPRPRSHLVPLAPAAAEEFRLSHARSPRRWLLSWTRNPVTPNDGAANPRFLPDATWPSGWPHRIHGGYWVRLPVPSLRYIKVGTGVC